MSLETRVPRKKVEIEVLCCRDIKDVQMFSDQVPCGGPRVPRGAVADARLCRPAALRTPMSWSR
jgi:hypothetical protein